MVTAQQKVSWWARRIYLQFPHGTVDKATRQAETRPMQEPQKRTKGRRPQIEVGESGQLHGTNEKVEMKMAANRPWRWRFHSGPFQALHHPCLCFPAGMEDVITVRR